MTEITKEIIDETGGLQRYTYDETTGKLISIEGFGKDGKLARADIFDVDTGNLVLTEHFRVDGSVFQRDTFDPRTGMSISVEAFDTGGRLTNRMTPDPQTGRPQMLETFTETPGFKTVTRDIVDIKTGNRILSEKIINGILHKRTEYAPNSGNIILHEEYRASSGNIRVRYAYDDISRQQTLYEDFYENGSISHRAVSDPQTGKRALEEWFEIDGQTLTERTISDPIAGKKVSWEVFRDGVLRRFTVYDVATGRENTVEWYNEFGVLFHRDEYNLLNGKIRFEEDCYTNGVVRFRKTFDLQTGKAAFRDYFRSDGSHDRRDTYAYVTKMPEVAIQESFDIQGKLIDRRTFYPSKDVVGFQSVLNPGSIKQHEKFDPVTGKLTSTEFFDETGKLTKTVLEFLAPDVDGNQSMERRSLNRLSGDSVPHSGQERADSMGLEDSSSPDDTGLNGHDHLDTNDARWSEFRIWQDKNQNGVSDPAELPTLTDASIRLISLLEAPEGIKQFSAASAIASNSDFGQLDGNKWLVADAVLRGDSRAT